MKSRCVLMLLCFICSGCFSGYDSKKVLKDAQRHDHPALSQSKFIKSFAPQNSDEVIAEESSAKKDHVSHDSPSKGGATFQKTEVQPGRGILALESLIQGNRRFVLEKNLDSNRSVSRRHSLVNGQAPNTIVLSCSDSRVPPELIFDKGLGELFVVRTAGEVADQVALASIEYAIEHLHASLVVVMGHTSCGAVKAALTTPNGKSAGSVNLDQLVSAIRPSISGFKYSEKDKTFIEPVKANVNLVAKTLVDRSEIIKHALLHDQITIVQALYNLDSGRVEFWL